MCSKSPALFHGRLFPSLHLDSTTHPPHISRAQHDGKPQWANVDIFVSRPRGVMSRRSIKGRRRTVWATSCSYVHIESCSISSWPPSWLAMYQGMEWAHRPLWVPSESLQWSALILSVLSGCPPKLSEQGHMHLHLPVVPKFRLQKLLHLLVVHIPLPENLCNKLFRFVCLTLLKGSRPNVFLPLRAHLCIPTFQHCDCSETALLGQNDRVYLTRRLASSVHDELAWQNDVRGLQAGGVKCDRPTLDRRQTQPQSHDLAPQRVVSRDQYTNAGTRKKPLRHLCAQYWNVWTSQYHIHALDFDAMSRADTIQDVAQSLASEAMFPIFQSKFPLLLFNYQLLFQQRRIPYLKEPRAGTFAISMPKL